MYEILLEEGACRKVYVGQLGDLAISIGVTRPQYLRDEMKSFFFSLLKRSHKKGEGYTHVSDYVGFDNLDELGKLVPTAPYEWAKISKTSVTRILNKVKDELKVLAEPEFYFRKTENEEQKQKRESLDALYKSVPGKTWREKNKYILERIASEADLPIELLPGLPDYTQLDRPLLPEEIEDDMENRAIMAQTAPFPIKSPDLFDALAPVFREAKRKQETQ